MDHGCLNESFNLEYLNDALWKATRFPVSVKMIDPETQALTTLSDHIVKMKNYIEYALTKWDNQHINDCIDLILDNGTEGDSQMKIYRDAGFKKLKQYLMDSVEYDY